MLLEEFDLNKDAIINPDMIIEKIENFPDVTVSCFSHYLFDSLLEVFDNKKILAEAHSATGISPIYEVEYEGEKFAFYHSYVGEPSCVGIYEDIIAMGSKNLILFGNCGVLDKNIEDCGIIIPTKAIRDEGTSFYYVPPGDNLDGDTWEPRSLSGKVKLDKKTKIALFAFELGLKIKKGEN